MAGAAGLLLLVLFIKRISERSGAGSHRYHWGAYGMLAAAAAAVSLLGSLNAWPLLMSGYDTATPLPSYLWSWLLERLTGLVLAGFLVFLAALGADVFLQWSVGDHPAERPSLVRAGALVALLWGLGRAARPIAAAIPGPRLALPLWDLPGAATLSPAVAVFSSGVIQTVLALCALVVVVSATARFLGPRGRLVLALAAAGAAASGDALTATQFLFRFLTAMAAIGLILGAVRTCGLDLRTFAVALLWFLVTGPASALIAQPQPSLRWNGIALAAIAVVGGLFLLRPRGFRGAGEP